MQYCSRNVSCALNEISAVLLIILDFFLQPFHCTIEAIILVIHFVMIKVVLYAYHLCQDIQLPICLTLILSSMSRYTIYLFVWLWSCHLFQDIQFTYLSYFDLVIYFKIYNLHICLTDLVIYVKIYNLPIICLTLILSYISFVRFTMSTCIYGSLSNLA